MQLTLRFPTHSLANIAIGASVAIEGCCLTVVEHSGDHVRFDLIQETLNQTMLGDLTVGKKVNFERSARFGDEVGGHIVSGHIHGTAQIIDIQKPVNNWIVTLKAQPQWLPYIFHKGFIALGGTSLTVVEPQPAIGTFQVHLIPETLALTTWSERKVGDRLNMEIDQTTFTIVETVKKISGFPPTRE